MLNKIFGKKGQAETPKQSQSMSGIGGSGQQIQAGRDAIATQQAQQATQQQGLTGADVVALLAQLQGAIEAAVDSAVKEELVDCLKVAKQEAGKTLWETGVEVFKAIAPWVGVATAFFGV